MTELERIKTTLGWKIGMSCSGVRQADAIRIALQRRMADGRGLFDSIQATWNVLEQSAGEVSCRSERTELNVILMMVGSFGGLLRQHKSIPTQI